MGAAVDVVRADELAVLAGERELLGRLQVGNAAWNIRIVSRDSSVPWSSMSIMGPCWT